MQFGYLVHASAADLAHHHGNLICLQSLLVRHAGHLIMQDALPSAYFIVVVIAVVTAIATANLNNFVIAYHLY